ncbi:hypothetical protein [Amycolatopsis sacchari]|uniref:hypothetical protein n=1 Tax=Amycolatopsis sacchari TaxID=115433 RepID=UPI003D72987B
MTFTDGSSNTIRADSNTKFLLRIIIGHATGRVPSDDLERKYQLIALSPASDPGTCRR